MSDRHYPSDSSAPAWAKKCGHCGKPMKRHVAVFGSNACRQAAYRLRLKKRVTFPSAGKNVTPLMTITVGPVEYGNCSPKRKGGAA